jgi:photosystem II stability/assembly factor-like uncharacterized protein
MTTADAGRSWTRVHAPAAPLVSPFEDTPRSVTQIFFANARDGWAFGPALWATTNGGGSWHRQTLGGPVLAMAAAAGHAYAIVGSCYPSSSGCNGTREKLERSTLGASAWATVPGPSGVGGPAYFAVSGATVFLALWRAIDGPAYIWESSNGTAWQRRGDLCYNPAQAIGLAGLAATSGSSLFELCAGNPGAGQEEKYVEHSSNAGATARMAGRLPEGGLTDAFAAATADDVVVGAASGASFLYSSRDAGRNWTGRIFDDGGAGLSDLQFSAPGLGAVIEGRPGLGGPDILWLSRNGGATWSAAHF